MFSLASNVRTVRKARSTNHSHRRLSFEHLETRTLLSITPITSGAYDHRWPSMNNQGDYAYSAQDTSGLWQVFVDGQQVTSGPYNKQFPVVADNKDVVYFQDGGSGGVGWQVIRHNNIGGESQIEFSSRDIYSGAHRDAGQYPGIAATDGTVISTYDFYDRYGSHTRRFNVSGVGRLSPDFYPYNYDHPDINVGQEIVYSGWGNVYKATVSSPLSTTYVATGSMGRINDAGDIVTVSGNLNSPGMVTIYSGPGYTQSTFVGSGSWADINNGGNVVFEGIDAQGKRQVYLYSGAADIDATSLTWNTAQGGVDFTYKVTGANLPQDTTAALYWATGPNKTDITTLAAPARTILKTTPLDQTITVHVATGEFFDPPAGTTHLLLVADPPLPNGIISESKEDNNFKPLALPDLTGQSFHYQVLEDKTHEQDGPLPFNGHFTVTAQVGNVGLGNASAFVVKFYASQDSTIDSGDQLLGQVQANGLTAGASQTIVVSSLMLPQNLNWTGKIHLGLMIDPDRGLPEIEASRGNNANQALAIDHAFVQLYDPIVPTRVITGFSSKMSAGLYLFRNGFTPALPFTGGGWSQSLPVSARITSRFDGVTRSGSAYRQQAFIYPPDSSHSSWWILWQGNTHVAEPNPETALFYEALNPGWFGYVYDWHVVRDF